MALAGALSGALARKQEPEQAFPEPPAPAPDLEYTVDDIPWDPTDADNDLGTDTYRDVALTRAPVFDNTPPDLITHPLGIPGLQLPYAPIVTADGELVPPDVRTFGPPVRFDAV
jgi:hypothetical protein